MDCALPSVISVPSRSSIRTIWVRCAMGLTRLLTRCRLEFSLTSIPKRNTANAYHPGYEELEVGRASSSDLRAANYQVMAPGATIQSTRRRHNAEGTLSQYRQINL